MLLRLAAEPLEDYIRQAAAMYLENHLSNQWSSLLPWEKERIKSLIVPLMFSAPVKIQIQLGRAGAVIGYQDFVRTWPGLLQNLIQKLENASQASDYASVYDSLSIADSICKKFYRRPITTELILELRYFLDTFAAPLLEVFLKTASLIDASVNSSPNVLCPLFESQTLCCSIFHSLYNMERSEFFPVRMKEWETEFEKYLNTTYPSLEEDRDEVGEDYLLSELRCSARYNLELCFLYADETRTSKYCTFYFISYK